MRSVTKLIALLAMLHMCGSTNIRSRTVANIEQQLMDNASGPSGDEGLLDATGLTGTGSTGSTGNEELVTAPPTTMISQKIVVWGLSKKAAETDSKLIQKGIAASIGIDFTNIEILSVEEVPSVQDANAEQPAAETDDHAKVAQLLLLEKHSGVFKKAFNNAKSVVEKVVEKVTAKDAPAEAEEVPEEVAKANAATPAADEPAADEPAADEPAADEPAADEPVTTEDTKSKDTDLSIAYEVAVEDESTKPAILNKMKNFVNFKDSLTKTLALAFKNADGGAFQVKGVQVLTMEAPVVETKTITAGGGANNADQTINVVREQLKVVTKNAISDLTEAAQQKVEDVMVESKKKEADEANRLGVMNVKDSSNMFDHEAALSLNIARKGIEGEDPELEEEQKEDEKNKKDNVPAATPAEMGGEDATGGGADATGAATGSAQR
jgi:hypothetical protein